MDPRDRADAALARASARRADVVTPSNAVSPMDSRATVQIPQAVVDAADPRNAQMDTIALPPQGGGITGHSPTTSLPAPGARNQPAQPPQQPTMPLTGVVGLPTEPPVPDTLEIDPDQGFVPTRHVPAPQRGTMSHRLDGGHS
jgi:hypothetical protein